MAQYLSQSRLEGPVWLEPTDIAFFQARMADVEAQVQSLDIQISELTRQKDAKLAEIATLKNMLSPVRRIPIEILSEIFRLSCLPEKGISMFEHSIVDYMSTLSTVCVAWRNTAHATPQLWSSLSLSLSKPHKPLMGEVGWVSNWMNRSQGLPVDLYLDLMTRGLKADQFLELAFSFGHKLRLLNLKGCLSFCLHLLGLPHSSLPQLERVFLEVWFDDWSDFSDWPGPNEVDHDVIPQQIEIFLGAPKLQCIELIDGTRYQLIKRFGLPLEGLTSLKLTHCINQPDIDNLMDILCRCKDLNHLRIDLAPDSLTGLVFFDEGFSMFLPSLKSLDVSAHDTQSNGVNLINCLTTPHIEELTLRYHSQELHGFHMDLINFQHRSATAISSLILHGLWNQNVDESISQTLIASLSLFPTLSSFQLHECGFDMNPLFRALTFTKGCPTLLPKLIIFELTVLLGMEYDTKYSELIPMILSRRWTKVTEEQKAEPGVEHAGLLQLQRVFLRIPNLNMEEFTEITEFPDLVIDLDSCKRNL